MLGPTTFSRIVEGEKRGRERPNAATLSQQDEEVKAGAGHPHRKTLLQSHFTRLLVGIELWFATKVTIPGFNLHARQVRANGEIWCFGPRHKELITMSLRSAFRNILAAVLITAPMIALPAAQAQIAVGVSFNVHIAPPALPVMSSLRCRRRVILDAGYWAYGEAGYYWVPGVWVMPPSAGLLWTPGYWGFGGGVYGWHAGYWGPHVGFYGGVNYGYGYGGVGFVGGEWRGGVFAYNRAVANFGAVHVTNVYENRTIVEQNTIVNVTTSASTVA